MRCDQPSRRPGGRPLFRALRETPRGRSDATLGGQSVGATRCQGPNTVNDNVAGGKTVEELEADDKTREDEFVSLPSQSSPS